MVVTELEIDNPSPKYLRECIDMGFCPWCGRDGFRVLAGHTIRAHGICADDIREMAYLLRHKPTCVKETSNLMSVKRLQLLKEGRVKMPNPHIYPVKRKYSTAGLVIVRSLAKVASETRRKPHACPICGTIIPHSKPICCSKECKKQRLALAAAKGRYARSQHFKTSPEFRERILTTLDKVRNKPKPHNCPTCGKRIPTSLPKFCSPQCASREFKLPMDEVKNRYIKGESSVNLAKIYGCSHKTICKHLRKAGVTIRRGNSYWDTSLTNCSVIFHLRFDELLKIV